MSDDVLVEMGQTLNPFIPNRRFPPDELPMLLKLGTIEAALPVIFDETAAVLDEPQRVEYSAVDGKLYLYQYSISANYNRLINIRPDMTEKGRVVAKAQETDNLLGHGEFTGPVVYIKPMSDKPDAQRRYLCKAALDEADRRFPEGYILVADLRGASQFDLGYLRGLLFQASQSDEVLSVDDTGFVLKDKQTGERGKGERRIEYPRVKGLLVTPEREFSKAGHHLEGVIEANVLGASAPFDVEAQRELFEEPVVMEGAVPNYIDPSGMAQYQVYYSRAPMRMAVDGLKRRALLHSMAL
jgi:hypothetical protein